MWVGGVPRVLTFVQTTLSVPSFHRRQLGKPRARGRGRVAGRVRRLPSHPRAPTLQDLWVLFLPLGPLDCSRVPMGSVSLLLSWPQNSGDPVSEPATHHMFQTLKSCPPTARFPRGGTGLREVQSLLEFTQNVGGRGDRLQAWD